MKLKCFLYANWRDMTQKNEVYNNNEKTPTNANCHTRSPPIKGKMTDKMNNKGIKWRIDNELNCLV